MDVDPFRRGFAEFVGAFALVFVGAGAIMSGADLVGVALAHGLVIAVMASAVGHISGGHFNPAVTLGFLVTRRMQPGLAVVYWMSQLGGAVLAALLLWWIYPAGAVDGAKLGTPALDPNIGVWAGVALEAILTFFLVWVVFATAADPRGTFKSIAGLAIGLTISFDVLVGGQLTGAAMNPARAFGPALVRGEWADAWVWYVGPLVGGAVAALVYEWLYLRPARPAAVGPRETGLEEPRPGHTAAS
ncbi:MAG: MIP family channel protein [Gaiellaceae bacterium]